jgi:hypothetical protein
VGQLPEFIQGRLGLVGRLGEQRSGLGVAVGLGLGAGEPEVVGEGQQALLGAIVQVAFQPPSFAVAGLHDADARGTQLVQLGERLGLQPLVLQRQPDGGAELALQVGQRRGVGDDRDPAAVANQRGGRTPRLGDRLGDRPASGSQ